MKSKTIVPCDRAICVEADNNRCHMIFLWDLLLEHAIVVDRSHLILCSFSTHPEAPVIKSVLYSSFRQLLWLIRVDVIDDFGVLIYLSTDQPKESIIFLIDKRIVFLIPCFKYSAFRKAFDYWYLPGNIFNCKASRRRLDPYPCWHGWITLEANLDFCFFNGLVY